jgi:hypothetical protein
MMKAMKYDGVATRSVTDEHGEYVEIVKVKRKYNKNGKHKESRFITIAKITKKQANALGNLLIIAGGY